MLRQKPSTPNIKMVATALMPTSTFNKTEYCGSAHRACRPPDRSRLLPNESYCLQPPDYTPHRDADLMIRHPNDPVLRLHLVGISIHDTLCTAEDSLLKGNVMIITHTVCYTPSLCHDSSLLHLKTVSKTINKIVITSLFYSIFALFASISAKFPSANGAGIGQNYGAAISSVPVTPSTSCLILQKISTSTGLK